jgi:hypothetical protein
MKNSTGRLLIAAALVAASAAPAFGQSGIAADLSKTPIPHGDVPESQPETITGRITKVDTQAGRFSVRAGDTRKVVDLIARKAIDTKSMRRGERVTVTYAKGIALTVQATRNEK